MGTEPMPHQLLYWVRRLGISFKGSFKGIFRVLGSLSGTIRVPLKASIGFKGSF